MMSHLDIIILLVVVFVVFQKLKSLLGTRPEEEKRVHLSKESAEKLYIKHLVRAVGDLSGLRVAVDCANGAASHLGPEALQEAGIDTVVINASPDGRNINDTLMAEGNPAG